MVVVKVCVSYVVVLLLTCWPCSAIVGVGVVLSVFLLPAVTLLHWLVLVLSLPHPLGPGGDVVVVGHFVLMQMWEMVCIWLLAPSLLSWGDSWFCCWLVLCCLRLSLILWRDRFLCMSICHLFDSGGCYSSAHQVCCYSILPFTVLGPRHLLSRTPAVFFTGVTLQYLTQTQSVFWIGLLFRLYSEYYSNTCSMYNTVHITSSGACA